MFKRGIVIFMVLAALTMLCSCKSEPELSEEDDKTASVGIVASSSIILQITENDSYEGASVRVSDDGNTIVFSFDNVSVPTDLSDIDVSWGKQTILIDGEVVMKYEAPPAEYPNSMSFNVRYVFGGKTHTLEAKIRETGVSSQQLTFLKFDGKEYNTSKITL